MCTVLSLMKNSNCLRVFLQVYIQNLFNFQLIPCVVCLLQFTFTLIKIKYQTRLLCLSFISMTRRKSVHGLMMDFHLPLMFTVAVNLDFCVIKGKVVLHAELHVKHVCSQSQMLYHTWLVTQAGSHQGTPAWDPGHGYSQ